MAEARDNTIYWVGGGLLAYLVYERVIKPRLVEPMQLVKFTNQLTWQLIGVKRQGDNLILDLRINNPEGFGKVIESLVGGVWVIIPPYGKIPGRRYKIAAIADHQKVRIKPTAESQYKLTVRTLFIGLTSLFTDMMRGTVRNMVLQLGGTININGRTWPLNEKFPVNPKLLQ